MSTRRVIAGWSVRGLVLLATCPAASAHEHTPMAFTEAAPVAEAPEQTGSITLETLSVKTLGVDRPWDPRVCIGCERNNSPAPSRHSHRAR
jgi:hypothetical protein